MKSTISYSMFLAGTACMVALAGCDSIKNVPEKPFANLPPTTIVLEGTITGLSSLRSITLMNNGNLNDTRGYLAGAPAIPNLGPSVVPFAFGAIGVGSAYNVGVAIQPYGKDCVVSNGQGTATAGVPINVSIVCTNTALPVRYDVTVTIPTDPTFFAALPGAKVRVTTEDEIIERTATPGVPVVFTGVLMNSTGQSNVAPWTVSASTTEGGTLNKCAVNNPTNVGSTTHPSANVTANVGNATSTSRACQFSVGGRIGYSLPAGTAYTSTAIAGLELQLKDAAGTVLETLPVATCTPTSATVTTGTTTVANQIPSFPIPAVPAAPACTYTFATLLRSGARAGLYEVVVSQHPAGQRCVVANGGGANVFTLGTVSPLAIDRAHVICRAIPPVNNQLHGVYRLQSSTWIANNAAPVPVTSPWLPFDFSVSNTASSNMLSLFSDGTFLYGSHGNAGQTGAVPPSGLWVVGGVQIEHGFYDYNPGTGTLRFTLVTDTNNSTTFPSTFSPLFTGSQLLSSGKTIANTQTTTPGLSATPNPVRRDNSTSLYMATFTMTGVTFGTDDVVAYSVGTTAVMQTVNTISGEFGGAAGGTASALNTTTACSVAAPCVNPATGLPLTSGACTAAAPCVMPPNANRLRWVLQEPPSIDTEMTGAWMTQDRRRTWVWDHRTYYGTGVAVVGGHPSMNDACFTMEDLRQTTGTYVRRGSGPGCHPYPRPATGQVYTSGAAESTDYPSFPASLVSPPALPGFVGRIPGGLAFSAIISPSPIHFHIAPASTFFDEASVADFPAPASPATAFSWCTASRPGDTAEVLGLRATLNGNPVDTPVYLCRTKVPLPVAP